MKTIKELYELYYSDKADRLEEFLTIVRALEDDEELTGDSPMKYTTKFFLNKLIENGEPSLPLVDFGKLFTKYRRMKVRGLLKGKKENSITTFKTLDDFVNFVSKFDDEKVFSLTRKELKKLAEKAKDNVVVELDNENLLVVAVNDFDTARWWSSNTNWCTGKNESLFNQYTRNSKYPLHIIIDKKTGMRFQLALTSSEFCFLNALNKGSDNWWNELGCYDELFELFPCLTMDRDYGNVGIIYFNGSRIIRGIVPRNGDRKSHCKLFNVETGTHKVFDEEWKICFHSFNIIRAYKEDGTSRYYDENFEELYAGAEKIGDSLLKLGDELIHPTTRTTIKNFLKPNQIPINLLGEEYGWVVLDDYTIVDERKVFERFPNIKYRSTQTTCFTENGQEFTFTEVFCSMPMYGTENRFIVSPTYDVFFYTTLGSEPICNLTTVTDLEETLMKACIETCDRYKKYFKTKPVEK